MQTKRWLLIGVLALGLAAPVMEARGRVRPRARASYSTWFYWVPVPEILLRMIYGPNPCLPIPQNTNRPGWCR